MEKYENYEKASLATKRLEIKSASDYRKKYKDDSKLPKDSRGSTKNNTPKNS